MKKIILILGLALFLVACSDDGQTDLVSSATNEWNSSESSGLTEANKQFAELRKESDKSDTSGEIRTVRLEVTQYIIDQFSEDNTVNKKVSNLSYRINNRSTSIVFSNSAKHIVDNQLYDYTIEIEKLEKTIDNVEFIDNYNDETYSVVKVPVYGQVLVKNIGDNSMSAILLGQVNKDDSTYIIKISSDHMSIPEILMLSEEFYKTIN